MKSTARKDGIRTVADLKLRCRIDTETGCWHWAGCAKGSSARVWLPDVGIKSVTFAVEYLSTRNLPALGTAWVPTCGNASCCNPAHRRPGTKSELFKAVMPAYTADHRAKVTRALRARSTRMDMQTAASIRASDDSLATLAARHSISETLVSRIRRGERWFEGIKGASVFSGVAA